MASSHSFADARERFEASKRAGEITAVIADADTQEVREVPLRTFSEMHYGGRVEDTKLDYVELSRLLLIPKEAICTAAFLHPDEVKCVCDVCVAGTVKVINGGEVDDTTPPGSRALCVLGKWFVGRVAIVCAERVFSNQTGITLSWFSSVPKEIVSKFKTVQRCEWCQQRGMDFKICGSCKRVYYCGRSCQQSDWRMYHKKACRCA